VIRPHEHRKNIIYYCEVSCYCAIATSRQQTSTIRTLYERREPPLITFIVSKLHVLAKQAVFQYGVNPVIFLTIYLSGIPVFYYSLFRMMRAIAKKLEKDAWVWSMVFVCSIVAPFLYVLLFGRNLPWWVYGIIALLIGQGIFVLFRKRGGPKNPTPLIP
jgi:hypothetical protein